MTVSCHHFNRRFGTIMGSSAAVSTSGILVTAHEFLQENQDPTEAEVRECLSGNLVRPVGGPDQGPLRIPHKDKSTNLMTNV